MPICRHSSPPSSEREECEGDFHCLSDYSVAISHSSGFVDVSSSTQIFETKVPPNIQHELNVAKSILQRGSTLTGDNLFDHLAELIKRVLLDRPENITDFFEEFSYNTRMQKFHIQEQFGWTFPEPIDLEEARSFFKQLKIVDDPPYDVCKIEKKRLGEDISSDGSLNKFRHYIEINENVCRLHLYWSLCGFNLKAQEAYKLAYAMQNIQNQPNIEHARFWGKIFGLKNPYYIVEVTLTREEAEIRLEKMREEMVKKMDYFRQSSDDNISGEIDMELIPGARWQNESEEDLERMRPFAKKVPKPKVDIEFDIPPEAIGTGLNRRSYFVVNSLNEPWMELPIVTPKQIQVSRQIKKLLTGDLEADISSYPEFPGTEKHYLRAMIARITSGTYIAPYGYYRKLTKKERMEYYGEEVIEVEVEEEEEIDAEGEEEIDNDAPIIENENYDPTFAVLMFSHSWVHVRPNILDQGRVVYFDEVAARKALEKESRLRMGMEEDYEMIEEEEVEEQLVEDEDKEKPWEGPKLFTDCSFDKNEENVPSWSARYTSVTNKICQGIIIRSNLWPGAVSFAFEKYADSIYLGWGFKFTGRNMNIPQIPQIQEEYYPDDYKEKTDPTVGMEDAMRQYLERKRQALQFFTEDEVEEEEIC